MEFTGVLRALFIWTSLVFTATCLRGPGPNDGLPSRDMWVGGLGADARYVCAAPIPWVVQRTADPTIKLTMTNRSFAALPFSGTLLEVLRKITGSDILRQPWNVSFAPPPLLDAAAAVAARIAGTVAEGTWTPETVLRVAVWAFELGKDQHVDSQPFCVGPCRAVRKGGTRDGGSAFCAEH